jgi:site-specific DNA-cytosine methylase
VVSALQAPNGGRGWRVDAEGAAGGHLVASSITLASDPISARDLAMPQTGRNGDPGVIQRGSSVRRLTPVECERLMSWPDGWTAVDGPKTPDSRRYAACGDGVVSNVAEWIGRRMLAADR